MLFKILITLIIYLQSIQCFYEVRMTNGVLEVGKSSSTQITEWKPFCQNYIDIDFGNLYCKHEKGTILKELYMHQDCQSSEQQQNNLPLEFGIVLDNNLDFNERCYLGRTVSSSSTPGKFHDCLEYDNRFKFNYDNGNQNCGQNSCVAIECYTESEYEEKVKIDAPTQSPKDHSLIIDDGNLLYYSDEEGYSQICAEDKYDLNDPEYLWQNTYEQMCKNLGYDYMESMDQVACDPRKYYYATAQRAYVFCNTSFDEEFEDCNVSYHYEGKCGEHYYNHDRCVSITCEYNLFTTTELVLIIVGASLLFIIILIIIIKKMCCQQIQQQKKVTESKTEKQTVLASKSLNINYDNNNKGNSGIYVKAAKKVKQNKQKNKKQNQGIYVQAAKKIKQNKQFNNNHPQPSYNIDSQQQQFNQQQLINYNMQPQDMQYNNQYPMNYQQQYIMPNDQFQQQNMYVIPQQPMDYNQMQAQQQFINPIQDPMVQPMAMPMIQPIVQPINSNYQLEQNGYPNPNNPMDNNQQYQ